MKFLVTAGPTREPIDPVRFLSNRSSGKMGYAVAEAARARGHQVVLISGPVSIEAPRDVRLVQVTTAEEMRQAVKKHISDCEALVMAAAVADWRPARFRADKIKKSEILMSLPLERTPDILKEVLPWKGRRIFVGFAAETGDVEAEARRKLQEKGLDLIVANDVTARDAGFEVDSNRVVLLARDGAREALPLMPKRDVADRIVGWVEARAAGG